ncbi:MAG: RsmE family RNA methyltransferase [Verrucomicrobiota bacterium]
MNLVLFDPAELAAPPEPNVRNTNIRTLPPLPRADARARHIVEVLRRAPGDTFDAGLINGPLGKATLVTINADTLTLTFEPTREPPPLPPVTLIIGLPRPQTARDILRDATTIGVSCIHFVATARTDPNYATSSLWTSGEWRRHLLTGAAQAFDTRLPEITWTHTLAEALQKSNPLGYKPAAAPDAPPPAKCHSLSDTLPVRRLALDPYEATGPLGKCHLMSDTFAGHTVLALGPERGWDHADRELLRAAGFTLVHLGQRILRSETAVVAALARIRDWN